MFLRRLRQCATSTAHFGLLGWFLFCRLGTAQTEADHETSSELLSLRLFIACGGRIGLLSKIFDRAVKNAVRDRRTHITLEHLDQAFRRAVWFSDEVGLEGGPFFAQLSDASAPSVCAQAMHLAMEVPVEEEDRHTHLGTLQGEATRPLTKKRVRQELTKVLG